MLSPFAGYVADRLGRRHVRNLVSISCGGHGDWAFATLRDWHVPLKLIFGAFAGVALIFALIVLLIKPSAEVTVPVG